MTVAAGQKKDIEHLLSPKLPDHTPKYYMWGGELTKRLPGDFAIPSHLSLGKTLRIFLHQSGTNARPIPALIDIYPKHVKNVSYQPGDILRRQKLCPSLRTVHTV